MKHFLKSLAVIFASAATVFSHQLDITGKVAALPLKVNVVHQFPQLTWVENLAVRSNSAGDILCTLITSPDLYLISPSTGGATLLYSFPVFGVLGITQLGHDIFYVAGGNFSTLTGELQPRSFSIFKVDIRGYDRHGVDGIQVTELVNIPEAILLNGVARLDPASKTLLVADSFAGVVWEVDSETGVYTNVSLPEMLPPPNVTAVGINGVKSKDNYMYWSNTGSGTLSRAAIDPISGAVSGPVEILATGIVPDDFVIGDHGYIWICQNFLNTLSILLPNGTVIDVAGSPDSLLVAGPTACEFGWNEKLYCSTTGGLNSSVNETVIGGEIFEIDTKGFKL
ncbi:hypothetical protein F5884DRAFT_406731 [Xylogone sp. PMI_703]|nr:hypothetical protein F5884DRAFT_406731 [Xylogone sp. PMI_703]